MELEFPAQYQKWQGGCTPLDLYSAPVVKAVPKVLERGARRGIGEFRK